jgi:FtsH-binding integral membrane protein
MNFQNFENNPVPQSTKSGAIIDQGLKSHMQRIYNRMCAGVLITALVSFVVGSNTALLAAIFGTPLKWVVMLAPLAVVMFGFNPARMSSNQMKISFGVLSVLYGLSFGAIFAVYTNESIAKAFFIAASMFAGLSIFGYSTKKNLDGLGTFAIMGMWGLLAASLISILMPVFGMEVPSMMSQIIAGIGIIVFAGMTAWQTQTMKEMYNPNDDVEMASRMSWLSALNLYVSFIAMFQYILQFVGNRE